MKVAYIVSRFPAVSETFIVRELDALSRRGEVDIELFSLFAAPSAPVHPSAQPWLERVRRPSARAAALACAWWLARRPLRLAATAAFLARAHARRPRRLLRALATLPLAAAHARTMSRLRIDHVHAHWATYPTLAAWVIWRLGAIPYTFTAHAHDIYMDQSQLATKVRDARAVVTISHFNRRFLERYGAGSTTPVEIVRCGLDLSRYPFRERRLPEEGPVRALCVATLQEKKGHRFLLEAIADSHGPVGRVHLDLVGGGELREPLEKLARELGVASRVRFLGALTEPEVAKRLARADLFVLPSIRASDGQMEGLPVVLMEALACGVPAIATRLSGVPELVRDAETGILAEPSDADSLRHAIERALADPQSVAAWARAGREAVEVDHDVDGSATRMAALFARLSPASPPGAGRDTRPARR